MGLVDKPHTHVVGDTIRSADVNDNDEAIYSTVNGNISNANVHASAEIAQSKIAGLTTSLGNKRETNAQWRLRDASEVVRENTAVESELYTAQVPAGLFNATDVIRGVVDVYVSSILTGATMSLLFYWGGTIAFTAAIQNSSGGTLTDVGAKCIFNIMNRGVTNAQLLDFFVSAPWSTSSIYGSVVGIAKDTTVAQSLQVNVLWSAASLSNSCRSVGLEMLRIR